MTFDLFTQIWELSTSYIFKNRLVTLVLLYFEANHLFVLVLNHLPNIRTLNQMDNNTEEMNPCCVSISADHTHQTTRRINRTKPNFKIGLLSQVCDCLT